MNHKKFSLVYLCLVLAVVLVHGQGKRKGKSTAGFYQYEVECEGSEMDGTQMVRAFGTGKNKEDAKEQAQKIAVYAIIFKGIRLGEPGCSSKPLVFNPNVEDQRQEFFNDFFKDGGKYKDFISFRDVPGKTQIKERAEGKERVFGIVMTIDRVSLKKYLQDKGIIPVSTD